MKLDKRDADQIADALVLASVVFVIAIAIGWLIVLQTPWGLPHGN